MGNNLDRWVSQAAREVISPYLQVAYRGWCGILNPQYHLTLLCTGPVMYLYTAGAFFMVLICNLDVKGADG